MVEITDLRKLQDSNNQEPHKKCWKIHLIQLMASMDLDCLMVWWIINIIAMKMQWFCVQRVLLWTCCTCCIWVIIKLVYGSRLLDGVVKNKNHCNENTTKLCTEGAVVNLLHMLHISDHEVAKFWEMATSASLQTDSIKKFLCLFHKLFQFERTSTLKVDCFNNIGHVLTALSSTPFPVLISFSV